jgi:aspartate aminotransferase-like enzyme
VCVCVCVRVLCVCVLIHILLYVPQAAKIDYVVSSSNKCYEGVPGFSFVLARQTALEATRGTADTLSLDIHAQLDGLENTGQFRFTPPTHALLAFRQGRCVCVHV